MARATCILISILILSGCRGRFQRSEIPEPATQRVVSRTETPAPSTGRTWTETEKVCERIGEGPIRFVPPIQGRMAPLPDDCRPRGVRFEAPVGTSVHAAADGEIALITAHYPSIGPAVLLSHAGGYTTFYGPVRVRPDLREGDRIAAGQSLGELASDGERGAVPCLRFRLLKRDVDVTDVCGHFDSVGAAP